MLKVYYNERSDADMDVKVRLDGLFLRVEVKDNVSGEAGCDIIESLCPYHSYSLINKGGLVKNYRTVRRSDYRLVDLNRLGVAVKLDFSDLQQLYGTYGILQVDTGMACAAERDVVIRVFMGRKESIVVEADMAYEVLPFDSEALPVQSHPRMELWDSYALAAEGRELQANRKGAVLAGDFAEPIAAAGKEFVEFEVRKYRGNFREALTRDIDDDEVLVESTCGVLDTRRVYLTNGTGSFRLYPLGYRGRFKLKLGRKWYEVWNEYNLLMGEG